MEFEKEFVMDKNFAAADSYNQLWEQHEQKESCGDEWDESEFDDWNADAEEMNRGYFRVEW